MVLEILFIKNCLEEVLVFMYDRFVNRKWVFLYYSFYIGFWK